MATSKTLELSIKIAGRMDKSLTAAINGTQSKIGSLTKSISNIGAVGLATMGAVATAAAVGIGGLAPRRHRRLKAPWPPWCAMWTAWRTPAVR